MIYYRVAHLLKLNEGRDSDKLELQHDSYRGMGENLYLQVCVAEIVITLILQNVGAEGPTDLVIKAGFSTPSESARGSSRPFWLFCFLAFVPLLINKSSIQFYSQGQRRFRARV